MSNNDKLKLYRFFGAEQFQKIVFKVEELKYLIIDSFFPNINKWYEGLCDKKYNKILKKHNLDKNDDLLKYYQQQKMLFRKEVIYKKNRNYHYDLNYPTKFIEYLKINKQIHIKGAIQDVVLLLFLGIISIFVGEIPLIVGVVGSYKLFSLLINFECINLQNYNICRFENEKSKVLFEKIEKRSIEKNIKQYGECIKPVSNAVYSQVELPTVDKVVSQITTRKQAVQLLNYAKKQLTYMENNQDKKQKEKKL